VSWELDEAESSGNSGVHRADSGAAQTLADAVGNQTLIDHLLRGSRGQLKSCRRVDVVGPHVVDAGRSEVSRRFSSRRMGHARGSSSGHCEAFGYGRICGDRAPTNGALGAGCSFGTCKDP
jgi:hypothetical protein